MVRIEKEMMPEFFERENEFRFIEVSLEDMSGAPAGKAIMCSRYSDQEYKEKRLKGDQAEFDRYVGPTTGGVNIKETIHAVWCG